MKRAIIEEKSDVCGVARCLKSAYILGSTPGGRMKDYRDVIYGKTTKSAGSKARGRLYEGNEPKLIKGNHFQGISVEKW